MSASASTLNLGTSQIAYRREGSGPDLVFVHGWPLHRETWRNVVAALPQFTCHLFDLPGAGETTVNPDHKLGFAGSVQATVEVVEHLELDDVVLVGHDSGGLMARKAAVQLGDRVRAMVLSGTEIPGHHVPLIETLVKAAGLPGASRVARRALASSKVTRSKYVLGATVANPQTLDGEFRRLFVDPLVNSSAKMDNALALLRSYTKDEVDELFDVHPQLKMPTLAIWGRRDSFFDVRKAEAMMGQFGGPTEFVVFDDARLLVHEDEPQRFAAQMVDFLAGQGIGIA